MYAISTEKVRSAVCPICNKENKLTLKKGSVIEVCEHFVKGDGKKFYFDKGGQDVA